MKLEYVEKALEGILNSLQAELQKQYEREASGIDTTEIENILSRIDKQIVEKAKVREEMINGTKESREKIHEMIEDIHQRVKEELDDFADTISKNEDIDKIHQIYKQNVAGSETIKTQKQLDEIEADGDAYKFGSFTDRLTETKKEFDDLKKKSDALALYKKVEAKLGSKDNVEKNFDEFETASEEWNDRLGDLKAVKEYNYTKEIEKLLKGVKNNKKAMKSKAFQDDWKTLNEHLHLLSSDPTLSKALDGKDLSKMSFEDVRKTLISLRSARFKEVKEIKENTNLVKDANEEFVKKMKGFEVLNIFPEKKKEFEDGIKAGVSFDVLSKEINEFATSAENRTILEDLSKLNEDKIKKQMLEVNIRLSNLQKREKDGYDGTEPTEPTAVTAMNTKKLDLSELGLSSPIGVKIKNSTRGDVDVNFANIADDKMEEVIDNTYDAAYVNATSDEKEKMENYVRKQAERTGIKIKKGFPLAEWFRSFMGRPTKEQQQIEGLIKMELKNRIENVKTQAELSNAKVEKYQREKEDYDKAKASWELDKADADKFKAYEREAAVSARGKKSAKEVVKQAKQKSDEDYLK